ncbi:Eukaryotic translation initiation factor 1A [Saitozyma sp. JCM 24511]|nr:Eukaryotic translation initiation factor 1A [Saitozyma sp. JCM 24511]
MPKGGKNRRRGKNEDDLNKRELIFKEDGQEYAQVVKMLGNGRIEAKCQDGETRLAQIRGQLRKKVWITAGDIILLSLREFQDDRADVIHRYTPDEARNLKTYGELKNDFTIHENAAEGEGSGDEDEDVVEFGEAEIDDICEWLRRFGLAWTWLLLLRAVSNVTWTWFLRAVPRSRHHDNTTVRQHRCHKSHRFGSVWVSRAVSVSVSVSGRVSSGRFVPIRLDSTRFVALGIGVAFGTIATVLSVLPLWRLSCCALVSARVLPSAAASVSMPPPLPLPLKSSSSSPFASSASLYLAARACSV